MKGFNCGIQFGFKHGIQLIQVPFQKKKKYTWNTSLIPHLKAHFAF